MPSEAAQTFPPTTSDHKKTHQFDSYVFVGVEVLSCRERQKKRHWKRASLCITPLPHPLQSPGDCTTSPTGSAAPKPRTRPRGVSRSRSPLLHCNTPANYPQMGHPHSSPGCWGPLPSSLGGGSFPAPAVPPRGAAAAALLRDRPGGRGDPQGCRGSVAAGPRPSTQPPPLGPTIRWRRGSGAGRS